MVKKQESTDKEVVTKLNWGRFPFFSICYAVAFLMTQCMQRTSPLAYQPTTIGGLIGGTLLAPLVLAVPFYFMFRKKPEKDK